MAQYTSFIGLYLTIVPLGENRPQWHFIIILAGFIIFLYLSTRVASAPKIYKDSIKINKFMYDWISSAGRVAIFSRDMSWANDDRIRVLLIQKAMVNELTVYAEHSNPLIIELEERGANVVIYGRLGCVPKSHFTIIDFERDGASVAVGVKRNGRHVIRTYRSGEHPFFSVAEDMMRIVSAASRQGTP